MLHESILNRETFEAPAFKMDGGFTRFDKKFDGKLADLIRELNTYAQGVKTNVLFFTRGETEKDNTKEISYYDLRTNQEGFGKTRPLRKSDFNGFMEGYRDPSKRTGERWSKFTREQIEKGHGDSLDLGLIRDDSVKDYDELPDPIESGEEAVAQLEEAADLLRSVIRELKALQKSEV